MLVGYARVSAVDQNTALQLDAFKEVGCEKVFIDKVANPERERPELTAAIASPGEGDSLVVWKLDRLAGSVPQLIETVALLEERGIGMRALTKRIDTKTASSGLILRIFDALADSNGR